MGKKKKVNIHVQTYIQLTSSKKQGQKITGSFGVVLIHYMSIILSSAISSQKMKNLNYLKLQL